MGTVFYSWQSDRDGKTGRSLIEGALKEAISAIKTDDTLVPAARKELDFDKDNLLVRVCRQPDGSPQESIMPHSTLRVCVNPE